jgi:hypothetical protein
MIQDGLTEMGGYIHTSHEGILDYDNSITDTMQKPTSKRGVLTAFHEMVYRANKWSTYSKVVHSYIHT